MPKSQAWDDRTGTFVQSVIRISDELAEHIYDEEDDDDDVMGS